MCGEDRVRKVDTPPPQSPNHKHVVLFIARPYKDTQNCKTVLIVFKELLMEDKSQVKQSTLTDSVMEMQWEYRTEKHQNQLNGGVCGWEEG